MEGDATNQETRLSNRSAPAAISFERSRIFAVISATVLRSAKILATSRACEARAPMPISLRQVWLPCPSRAYGVWHPFDSSSQRQSYLGNGRKIHMGSSPGSFEGGWTLPGIAFADSHETLDFAGSRPPCPPSPTGLYRENWTLPGRYPKSRLMAPRDGAMRAGIGGFDGFRMMPVAPSRATSASG